MTDITTYPFELPSGGTVELREMGGAEEDILTNSRLLRNGDAVNQVLRNCSVVLNGNDDPSPTDIAALLSGDRLFMLVKARQISLGDEAEIELVCNNPNCGAKNFVHVNLEDCKVTPYPKERLFKFTTTKGTEVEFVHMDGTMEKRLAQMPKEEVTLGTASLMRIKSLNGKPPSKKTFAELTMKERTEVREEMKKVDGGIDTVIEVVCVDCGQPIKSRLEANQSFFFPGVR